MDKDPLLEKPEIHHCILYCITIFRVYGEGTDAIIDRAAEVENMARAHSIGIGSQNFLIQEVSPLYIRVKWLRILRVHKQI